MDNEPIANNLIIYLRGNYLILMLRESDTQKTVDSLRAALDQHYSTANRPRIVQEGIDSAGQKYYFHVSEVDGFYVRPATPNYSQEYLDTLKKAMQPPKEPWQG